MARRCSSPSTNVHHPHPLTRRIPPTGNDTSSHSNAGCDHDPSHPHDHVDNSLPEQEKEVTRECSTPVCSTFDTQGSPVCHCRKISVVFMFLLVRAVLSACRQQGTVSCPQLSTSFPHPVHRLPPVVHTPCGKLRPNQLTSGHSSPLNGAGDTVLPLRKRCTRSTL